MTRLGSPDGVREVVNQRLERLTNSTTDLLELAAVAGAEFDLSVIAGSGLTGSELDDALAQATAHGMIEELPSGRVAYRFTHELVRRALYDRLPARRRAALHLQVAEALEAADRTDGSRGLDELAHHFAAAAALDGPERAIEYSILAGGAALSALDFDEAETCSPRRRSSASKSPGGGPRRSWSSARRGSAPDDRTARSRRSRARRSSDATSVTPSCLRPRQSGSRRRAGGPASPIREPSGCWRRRHGHSAAPIRRCV